MLQSTLVKSFAFKSLLITISYCMVCVSVREDSPRALTSRLLPYRSKTINELAYYTSMHFHFVHYKIFDVKHWIINGNKTKKMQE